MIVGMWVGDREREALVSDPLSWLSPQHFTTLNKAKAGKLSGSVMKHICVQKKTESPLTPRRLLHDKSVLLPIP